MFLSSEKVTYAKKTVKSEVKAESTENTAGTLSIAARDGVIKTSEGG